MLCKVACPSQSDTFLMSRVASKVWRAQEWRLSLARDNRHSFAVHRLVSWYRQGADVQHLLPCLSTYLGHASIASTQVYLQMTPELLREASRRYQRYADTGTGADHD